MSGDLGLLVGKARAAEKLDICCHAAPNKPLADITEHSIAASMGEAVNVRQKAPDKRGRDNRA